MELKSRIGLGTVQFGTRYGISNTCGQTPASEISKILSAAADSGVDLLDTASAYGSSEELLGLHELNGFRIVSKFLSSPDSPGVYEQLSQSLKKLRQDFLYGYLAHQPDILLKEPVQWTELLKLRERQLASKIGYSLYRPDQLEKLLDAGFIPDLVQVPYNYFDRRFEPWFQTLKGLNCEIHIRSVFLQGLFFVRPERLDPFFDTVKPLLDALQADDTRLPGGLLRFVLDQPLVDRVILGVENSRQLMQNIEALTFGSPTASGYKLPELKVTVPETILIPSEWPKTDHEHG